jgi:ADP-ribose pyrophosphatase
MGIDMSNSVADERGTVFLACDLIEAHSQPEATELLHVVRIPFWEAIKRVKQGAIRDSISIAALLRVALMALQGELPEAIASLIRS